ncbi:hypothetical protein [Streptomyces spectabilis]|uniref:Uncharacterized protein n=1 Tax=Streptomyces spectabilis TaxID=68270 RepID=A0A516R149_STRST|nr:hypothetical protein [Streptomyces spectabilis]QDQ09372.1 hypothetical protein FH965_01320 [Streptomyces spectabilis]
MNDRMLRLYPAGYRSAYGEEIVDVHREMTADLPRAARLRADADLAAHALRVRLGLDSASRGGRFFAVAAPFTLAATAVSNGLVLTRWYAGLVISPAPAWTQLSHTDLPVALHLMFSLSVCVGAIVALTGRWVLGVAAAVCGLLGTAVQGVLDAPLAQGGGMTSAVTLLAAAVVLACPVDRRPGKGLSGAAAAVAGIGWFPVVVADTGAFGVTTDYGVWPMLVLAVAGAALALRRQSSGAREIGAVAVASTPLAVAALAGAGPDLWPLIGMLLVLSLSAALGTCAIAARRRR